MIRIKLETKLMGSLQPILFCDECRLSFNI